MYNANKEKPLNILVICAANPAVNPRPSRLINHLKKSFNVSAIGINSTKIEGVKTYSYSNPNKRSFLQEIGLYLKALTNQYKKMIYIPTRLPIIKYINEVSPDVIFCHDLLLLPIVLENKKDAKVIFDAREFYPRQMEDNLRWRILFAPLMNWLCKEYLKKVDYLYTVSEGLAKEYEKCYQVHADVIMSSSKRFNNLNSFNVDNSNIKLIHHGVSNKNRSIHLMIEMMDYVDKRFTLDLMLVCSDKDYYDFLLKESLKRENVKIIPPVEFENIIPFLSSYDIGVFLVPPVTFNLKHCLPNKFFEFIQARLAIAIGPSIDMSNLVRRFDLGIINENFNPKHMADSLNNLTVEDINKYKLNSDKAANELNSSEMNRRIDEIIKKVCFE